MEIFQQLILPSLLLNFSLERPKGASNKRLYLSMIDLIIRTLKNTIHKL